MNDLGINFTADLGSAIADLPNALTIGARDYCCIADEERAALDVEETGRYTTYERNVHLLLSDFPTLPVLQSTATLDELIYWIADITRHDESDTLIFALRRRDGGTASN